MKIIVAKSYDEMSQIAAQHVLSYMYQNRRVNLSITAGSTPIKMYELLVPQVANKNYFEQVHYYNFDEIPYQTGDREGVTISNLRKYYLTPARVNEANIHILDEKNYQTQDQRLIQDGGLDMMIMGIGSDGHYCGNLPGTTTFNDWTRRVDCDEKMRQRLAQDFAGDINMVPDFYVTMGPRSVMQTKHLVMIANGKAKAEIIKRVVKGDIDENIPATLLTLHPNFTLILDEDAASLL